MLGWHLTWQDPVAVGLAIAGLGFAWWLRRRLDRSHGCAGCPVAPEPPQGLSKTPIK